MGEYFREPRNKGKKKEMSKVRHDQDCANYKVKISFTGIDKCLDSYDDIHRSDSKGWGRCRSWKDATKRKHQYFKHIIIWLDKVELTAIIVLKTNPKRRTKNDIRWK